MRRLVIVFICAIASGLTCSAEPGPLAQRILQRKDKEERLRAVAEVLSGLQSTNVLDQNTSLSALQQTADVPYDRKQFVPRLRELLTSPNAAVRASAAGQLPVLSKDVSDLPRVAELANDKEETVRPVVAPALFTLDPQSENPLTRVTIEKLLDDSSEKVLLATIHSLWGHAISPKAEARVVELSRRPGKLGYDSTYYGLSTRPLVSRAVAERLIELLPEKDWNVSGRAAWGMSHHKVSDEAKQIVLKAFIAELDETLQPYVRENCIYGLGQLGGAEAVAKLKTIADNSESSAKERDAAKTALKRAGD